MENWQTSHIRDNLVDLIKGTMCNEIFLAHLISLKVLANIDKEGIEARDTNSAKAERLYDLVLGRINGYFGVMSALLKCKQSGPFEILMGGVLKYGIPNTFVTTACEGTPVRLSSIFSNDDFSDLGERLRENLSDEKCLERILKAQKKENSIALVKETIPPPVPYHVSRRLSKRCKINTEMFKVNCIDVMVFVGIKRHELTELVSPNLTSSSKFQLQSISCRFIFLENDADWEEICTNADVPVHLIKCEKENNHDSFILLETTMPTETLREHMYSEKSGTENPSISEEEFTEVCQHLRGICVCDTPGMGKTILLASLARSIAKKSPNKIVCFIPIAKFVQQRKLQLQDICDKNSAQKIISNYISTCNLSQTIILNITKTRMTSMALFFDGFDEVYHEDVNMAKRFLKMLVTTPTIQVYVTARPHMRKDLEDTLGVIAYDIIPFTESDQINYLTNHWKQTECDVKDQIKLKQFAKFCLKSIKENLNSKDRDIMGIPLQCFLMAEVNKGNAQIYSYRRRCSEPETICAPVKTVYDMYKQFVNSKIPEEITTTSDITALSAAQSLLATVNNLCLIYTRHVSSRLMVSQNFYEPIKTVTAKRDKVIKYHVWKALEIFDPEISNQFFNEEKIDQSISMADILKFGIMEGHTASRNKHGIKFVHQTMAEYFVAEFVADFFTNSSLCLKYTPDFQKNVTTFFTNDILCSSYSKWYDVSDVEYGRQRSSEKIVGVYTFYHSVITTFLNERLSMTMPTNVSSLLLKKPFANRNRTEYTLQILQTCIALRFTNLFLFLKHQISYVDEINTIRSIYKGFIKDRMRRQGVDPYWHQRRRDFSSDDDTFKNKNEECGDQREIFVYLCALYGDVAMTEECFQLVRDHFGHDLSAFCDNMPPQSLTPLHIAIQEGNYEMVEYFANKVSLQGRRLLCYCLRQTYNQDFQIVQNKVSIWLFLRDKNRALFDEANEQGKFCLSESLSCDKVHIDLVKCIVEENAQVLKWDGGNFVSKATVYMSSSDFHELSVYLISHKRLYELFPPETVHNVFSRQKNLLAETTNLLLSVPEISINQTNQDTGDNLLLSAVRGNQDVCFVKELIKMGVAVNATNNNGESALHLAAKEGNVNLAELFISLNQQVDAVDNKGNTPLLRGSEHFNMIKYLIDNGASGHVTNNKGNTFVLLAARKMASGDEFREFLDLIINNGVVEMFSFQNKCHQTPFHLRFRYSRWGDIDILKALLDKSEVNVNTEDNQGNTLLLSAVLGKPRTDTLQALIDWGAVENYKNSKGKNVLHLALKDGDVKTVEFFLQRGFDLSQTNKNGFTPLDKAISIIDKFNKGKYVYKGTVKRLKKIIPMLQDATKDTC